MISLRAKKIAVSLLVLLLTLSCRSLVMPETLVTATEAQLAPSRGPENHTTSSPVIPIGDHLLDPGTVTYLGAFRLPDDGETEQTSFSWGGEALAYHPRNHSLFVVGHAWHINVAEISIPPLTVSRHIDDLAQAEILQPFADFKGDVFNSWTLEIPRVGLEVVGERLFFCVGEHMEEDTIKGTHGYTSLDLCPAESACVAGDALYATNDYLFKIPGEWQALFGGNDLFTGRYRDGGWSGMGPSLFAVSSEAIIAAGRVVRISATPVLHYDSSYDIGADDPNAAIMDGYSHADSWTGGAFIDTGTARAVLFVGTHGWGETWYGFSNGVVYPVDGDEGTVYPDVPPYPHDARGWWNDDFRATMLFYDPSELAGVFAGEMAANTVQPYASVDLSAYMLVDHDETVMQYLGGVAYAEDTRVLYVLELFADGDKPVVHAFGFE